MSVRIKLKYNAPLVIARLREQYESKAWAFLEQVRGGTGAMGSRYCDALAMSLWPSRGFDIIGFEVKVARSDWLAELRQAEKADEIFKYCNQWYLAAAPDVALPEEIPAPWGFMEMRGAKEIVTVKAAPALTPAPLAPEFVGSVLRNVMKQWTDKRLREEYHNGHRAGFEAGKAAVENPKPPWEFERLQKSVADFEQASGIKIEMWNGGKVGDVVRRQLGEDLAQRCKREIATITNFARGLMMQIETYEKGQR
jgi:hypothetical protein